MLGEVVKMQYDQVAFRLFVPAHNLGHFQRPLPVQGGRLEPKIRKEGVILSEVGDCANDQKRGKEGHRAFSGRFLVIVQVQLGQLLFCNVCACLI